LIWKGSTGEEKSNMSGSLWIIFWKVMKMVKIPKMEVSKKAELLEYLEKNEGLEKTFHRHILEGDVIFRVLNILWEYFELQENDELWKKYFGEHKLFRIPYWIIRERVHRKELKNHPPRIILAEVNKTTEKGVAVSGMKDAVGLIKEYLEKKERLERGVVEKDVFEEWCYSVAKGADIYWNKPWLPKSKIKIITRV